MLTLEETKLYLRVDLKHDDTLIVALIEAATVASADYLNLTRAALLPESPSPIKAATLLMVTDLYENREAQSDRQFFKNPTYERLLNPYRMMAL